MGAFGGLIQTQKGRNLQAKAETGKLLKFTRMGIGDGQLSGQSIPTLTKLISEKKSLPITRLKVQLPSQAVIGAVLSNQDVTTGFYFRELGIFAQDPDEGEILYAYGNSGSGAEYIPPAGTADIIEKTIDMIVTFGQAQNVSAVINSSLVYATPDDVAAALEEAKEYTDEAVAGVEIPDASLTVKGKVKLSSATDSPSETDAATPKAVMEATLQAKSYTDQQISLVTETGIPKLVSYPLLATATVDNQKVFEIPLDLFDANTDTLLVAINRAVLDATQYTVTNTVRDGAGQVTQRAKINLVTGVAATSEVTMVVLKNVPIGPDGAINGAVLALESIPINRVNGLQDQIDEVFQSVSDGKSAVASAITDKGVPASGSDTFPQLADKIGQIRTGSRTEYTINSGHIVESGSYTIASLPPGTVFTFIPNNISGLNPALISASVSVSANTGAAASIGLYVKGPTGLTSPGILYAAASRSVPDTATANIYGVEVSNGAVTPGQVQYRYKTENTGNPWSAWRNVSNSNSLDASQTNTLVINFSLDRGNDPSCYVLYTFLGVGYQV